MSQYGNPNTLPSTSSYEAYAYSSRPYPPTASGITATVISPQIDFNTPYLVNNSAVGMNLNNFDLGNFWCRPLNTNQTLELGRCAPYFDAAVYVEGCMFGGSVHFVPTLLITGGHCRCW